MSIMIQALIIGLAVIGTLFIVLASIGILRMPDLYSRMQTSTKASTLGAICVLSAVAVLNYQNVDIALRALGISIFLLLTAPISAHILCRAGVTCGVPMTKGYVMNDLEDEMAKGKIHG